MAIFSLTDASVTINAVDLSDHVRSVTVNMNAEEQDISAMGTTARKRVAGLRDDSFEVEFYQDFASGEVDATIAPLIGAASFQVIVKPTSAAISATNPAYTANAILITYQPIAGTVGEVSTTTVTFPCDGPIIRDITP